MPKLTIASLVSIFLNVALVLAHDFIFLSKNLAQNETYIRLPCVLLIVREWLVHW